MRIKENIKYEGWELSVDGNSIEVSKYGEHRLYDLDGIEGVRYDGDEYVMLDKVYGFYQIKFEVDNFLVIDEFDEYNEFVKSVANYVFNE